MQDRFDLVNRIEELGQTTIAAIEHAAKLVDQEEDDALATLPIMTEVLEAYSAMGSALPLTLYNKEARQETGADSVDAAFTALVQAYELRDSDSVRNAIQNEVLPRYKSWFDTVQETLPRLQH